MARKVSLLSHTVGDPETQRSFRLLQEELARLIGQAESLQAQLDELAAAPGGSGETNTASNLGAGAGVYASKVGVDLRFKSIVAGTGMTVTPSSNSITLDASGAGEANTASNVGAGSQVFKAKTAVDLAFRSLVAGANISLTQNADDITIAATDTGEVNTASNLGAGDGLYASKAGSDLQFKSLVADPGITSTAGTNDVTLGLDLAAVDLPDNPGVFSCQVHGDVDFDGVSSPVANATRAGSIYTLSRNVYARNITIAAGVEINPAGHAIYATRDITGGAGAIIRRNGNNGTSAAVGAALASGTVPGSIAGNTGNSANAIPALGAVVGTVPGGNGATIDGSSGSTGQGGGGGLSGGVASGGGAVTSFNVSTFHMGMPQCLESGRLTTGTLYNGASGGAGAATSGGTIGGKGGSGGGWITVVARSMTGVSIEAIGGNGGNSGGGNGGGGGGGAGGVVIVLLATGSAPPITVTGGSGGTKTGTGGNGGSGGSGITYVRIADA